jgi:hypothetical protein
MRELGEQREGRGSGRVRNGHASSLPETSYYGTKSP